jgi:hypothetical protein
MVTVGMVDLWLGQIGAPGYRSRTQPIRPKDRQMSGSKSATRSSGKPSCLDPRATTTSASSDNGR